MAPRILCIAGARPNYMKVKPVLDALEARGAETVLVHTGQHYDRAMNDVFFEELGIRPPDYSLGVGSGSHAEQTARTMTSLEPLLRETSPDVVVVVGDVNGTMGSALVAAKHGALVAHVEAGLRSRDWSMPEEINRVVTDRVSDYLLASSPDAVTNLRSEGYRDDQIHLVGNTMVDTLLRNLPRADERTVHADIGVQRRGYGLVTLHRPATVDDPQLLGRMFDALGDLAQDLPLVFPVHPRTRAALDGRVEPRVHLIEPAGYLDFIALEAHASVVITDSGGVQEETTVLGVPCLTVRDNTERPITIDEGTNRLVGRDPAAVVTAARAVLASPPPPRRPELWDGRAGERIAEVLLQGGSAATRGRPTDLPR